MKKYYNLNEILDLGLEDEVNKVFKECFGKRVFYNTKVTRIGILDGIQIDDDMVPHYIIDCCGKIDLVPVWKSVTKV